MSEQPRTVKATAWGVLWRERNRLNGRRDHLIWFHSARSPALFVTRKAACAWIKGEYGYIARRPDLRAEPFGWRMPRAVRVTLTVDAKQEGR